MKDGNIPTFYTNRALCYLRLQRWDLVCKDCSTAIERDGNCLKAYYFMGVAMMEKGNHDEAINLLQKGKIRPLLLVLEDEGSVFCFFNPLIDWLTDCSFFCHSVETFKNISFFYFSFHIILLFRSQRFSGETAAVLRRWDHVHGAPLSKETLESAGGEAHAAGSRPANLSPSSDWGGERGTVKFEKRRHSK